RDSVVRVMRREAAGREVEELVCYYVSRREVEALALREHLRERVIEETAPSRYVRIGRVPLTLNGKVNHEALPDPWGGAGAEGAGPGEASETERALAGMWAEVLGVERVGRGDNFFELGGHSLLATLVVMRVEELFGVGLALRSVFEAPTVAQFASLIDAARKETEQQEAEEQETETGRIPRVSREQPLPLSFAQQRLWFLNRLAPDEASYNAPLAYSISGPLDVAALEESLNRIVERHEVLRTTITLAGGEPVQVVSPHSRLTLEVSDLSADPAGERLARARAEVEEEGRRPFDLARGPVVRARLLRLGPTEHVLAVTMHHIVSDGWSVGVFIKELAAFYEAFCRGEDPPLAELPIQYADYAAWQRGWLQGEELERQLAYWRGQLAGAPTVLELPADRPRPKMQTSRGAFERFEISADVISKLGDVSRQEGATLFMTLLAAFGVLLSRYTGQKDFLLGAPIANRGQKELEGLIGFFVNTLALRMQIEDELPFRTLVRNVRETCLGAYAHQDVPFEKLVEELQPERDLSRPPLFQVAFALQNSPGEQPHLPGLSLKPFRADTHTAKFELLLNLFRKGEGVAGGFEYNADLFDAETIERLVKHFQTLLRNLADEPEREVADVSMLTAEEERYFVYEWNETAAAYPLDRCVHELIAEQAARTPEAVAVVYGSQSLTYAQLDAASNRLAQYLVSRGVGPETRVAILLEHSPQMVVAVLGALKAGAAYVPLEPGHPPLRLAFQMEDSEPALLLTEQSLLDSVEAKGVPAFLLDAQWEELKGFEAVAPEVGQRSEAEAYVIYTSGSTGRPKGVKITHRSLVNYTCWAASEYLGDGADSFALYSSLAFDLTVTSLFAPLICGRRAVVYAREGRESPILRVFEEGAAEVVKLTPSHLALVASLDNRRGRIRRLVVGGESLTAELARRAWESFGGRVEIVNEYGPTEATVGCMIHRYDPARDAGARVPIGRPAANSHVYVVDARGREAGEGVAGELLVSGEGVAAGYHNRSELTAERFVADPYRAGARLYRTGDVARRLPGGLLDYVGRRDEQVKYHGHRVELGELRAAVNSHPEVRDSVVRVMRREAAGREVEELVCYYVSRREVEALALREHLRE
ncbi:MAG TPA: amino acid adenylation domain-containing protein, partial [Pyrinomonadaceae bacterium]